MVVSHERYEWLPEAVEVDVVVAAFATARAEKCPNIPWARRRPVRAGRYLQDRAASRRRSSIEANRSSGPRPSARGDHSARRGPRPSGATEIHGRPGFRVRVGDFRASRTVDNNALIVAMIAHGHRRYFYNRWPTGGGAPQLVQVAPTETFASLCLLLFGAKRRIDWRSQKRSHLPLNPHGQLLHRRRRRQRKTHCPVLAPAPEDGWGHTAYARNVPPTSS